MLAGLHADHVPLLERGPQLFLWKPRKPGRRTLHVRTKLIPVLLPPYLLEVLSSGLRPLLSVYQGR